MVFESVGSFVSDVIHRELINNVTEKKQFIAVFVPFSSEKRYLPAVKIY